MYIILYFNDNLKGQFNESWEYSFDTQFIFNERASTYKTPTCRGRNEANPKIEQMNIHKQNFLWWMKIFHWIQFSD